MGFLSIWSSIILGVSVGVCFNVIDIWNSRLNKQIMLPNGSGPQPISWRPELNKSADPHPPTNKNSSLLSGLPFSPIPSVWWAVIGPLLPSDPGWNHTVASPESLSLLSTDLRISQSHTHIQISFRFSISGEPRLIPIFILSGFGKTKFYGWISALILGFWELTL